MRRLLVPFISAFLAAGVVSVTGPASACSTILVGKRASVTGHVLVGHNEDDEGELVVNHGIVPARVHAPGTTLEREPGCAAVPQSARTAAFYWSEVRSAECGLSNADAFLNEYGVFIVSNNACADADEDAASTVTDGGIRYVLRRAVAERATSARHAVEIATNLVMTWGYSLPGRMYSFADRDEAWVLQIVKGRRFVARRCPDDQVVAIPNCYTIARLQAGDVVSPDIVARAAAEPGFVFNRSYQGAKRWRHRADVYRWRHMLRIVSGRDPEQTFPFSSSVTRPVRPEDLVRALSTHYEGTVDVAECPHGSLSPERLPVCRDDTVESSVCVFGGNAAAIELRTAFGIPCQRGYVSFRPFSEGIPPAYDRSADAICRLQGHFLPAPR